MQSLTYEERTEVLDPKVDDNVRLMTERLKAALVEYLTTVAATEDIATVEDFCCWVSNETAQERDPLP